MKIVKIDIEKTDYFAPYIDMIKEKPPLKVTDMFDDMPIKDLDEYPLMSKETYPMQTFTMNKHYERYYIRDKDKLALEELINVFVILGRKKMLEQIIEALYSMKKRKPMEYLEELLNKENEILANQ